MGWQWDYVEDTLTYSRLEALMEYWFKNPPVHITVARALGYEAKKKQLPKHTRAAFVDLPEVEE